jgi:hypothetical protein
VVRTLEVDQFPEAPAVETDEFEAVGQPTRVTARWEYLRLEVRDKMAGPAKEQEITPMWDLVAKLLERGWPELAEARA